MSLLDVAGVSSGYQKMEILHDIDLSVERGEVVTVIGANGAGKSTLMRTLCGLLPLKAGEIRFDGRPVGHLPTYERIALGVGYVPQDFNVFPDLTVRENLEMGAFTVSRAGDRMEEVYGYFPKLRERSHQYGSTLSGGERQMLAIGSALLTSPRLLILDEPVSGLSPQMTESLIESIGEINRSGCSILWVVEENPRETLAHADRVVLLANGRVVKEGTARAFLEDENFEALFLGQA